MRAHQFELSTEALDFYGRVALSFREEGHDCFYGRASFLRNGHTFLLGGQVIVCTEEALDSPRNDRRFLRNDLSFLHRTVRFTQNTTIFFKEGWHNFKEIVTFLLGSDVPSGPP